MKIPKPKVINLDKISVADMLKMFRRGEHRKKGSDAFYLNFITQAAISTGNEKDV